jgi:hypothetical protein
MKGGSRGDGSGRGWEAFPCRRRTWYGANSSPDEVGSSLHSQREGGLGDGQGWRVPPLKKEDERSVEEAIGNAGDRTTKEGTMLAKVRTLYFPRTLLSLVVGALLAASLCLALWTPPASASDWQYPYRNNASLVSGADYGKRGGQPSIRPYRMAGGGLTEHPREWNVERKKYP